MRRLRQDGEPQAGGIEEEDYMAPKFDSLNKLFETLRDSSHDFRVTTNPFPPMDAEKLSKTLELSEKADRNGRQNLPPTDATEMDDVERSIVDRVESQRDDSYQVVEDQLSTYATRLRNLDFDGHFGQIQLANHASVADFKVEVAGGRDELHGLRKDLRERDVELAEFREKNGLQKRVARTKGGVATTAKWLVIAALLIVETWVNGTFLAVGSNQGFLGGIMYALAFAFANVILTVLLGLYVVPRIVHRSFLWKIVGLAGIAAWLVVAVSVNLVMAHYREVSATMVDAIGPEVMRRLNEAPLAMSDIDSWVLFVTGMIFSLIALIDSLLISDPYPGYAGTHERYVAARQAYVDRKRDLIDELTDIRNDHNEKVEWIVRELSTRRKESASILDARARMVGLFAEHQDHLELVAQKLLAYYREANRQARTTAQPMHFKSQYTMMRRDISLSTENDWSDKDLAERIQEAQDQLKAQMKQISVEFEAAVTAYHQLDNLFPETSNGPA